ncbi:unnamed protein product, partial [Staurois parvus]
ILKGASGLSIILRVPQDHNFKGCHIILKGASRLSIILKGTSGLSIIFKGCLRTVHF